MNQRGAGATCAAHRVRRGCAEQREPELDLVAQQLQHVADTVLAACCKPVEGGSAGQRRLRAERQRLQHVAAAADPAVDERLGAATDRVDHLGQRVERGRDAVQLPATVIRDDHSRRTVLAGELRVLGGEDPLDDERQAAHAAQPLQVAPGERAVGDGAEACPGSTGRSKVIEMQGSGNSGQDQEAAPHVALATTRARQVDGQHDGAVATVRHLVKERLRELAVIGEVELEPALAAGRGRRDGRGRTDDRVDWQKIVPAAAAARAMPSSPSGCTRP